LNDWRKDLETDPKKFSALPYAKLVEWRRQIGIQIPEEERMAQLFQRVVAVPLNHLYSGTGLFILGYFKESADELQKGVRELGNQSADSIAHYYLGLAYQKVGQTKQAEQEFDIFVKHGRFDPKDPRIETAKKISDQIKSTKKSA